MSIHDQNVAGALRRSALSQPRLSGTDRGVSPQEVIFESDRISTTGMGLGGIKTDHERTVAIVPSAE